MIMFVRHFILNILLFSQAFIVFCHSFHIFVRHLCLSGIHDYIRHFIRFTLQVYYLDNLLCDVQVPVGTPRCKFFNGKIIDNIIKFDKKLFDEGFTYGFLNVSK